MRSNSSNTREKTLRIAICGTRGIPACYGGFETFAEELSTRLVQRGHSVTVYGRSHVIKYREPFYRGVEIKLIDAPQHKYLETPVHTFRTFREIKRNQVDVVLLCNAANSPFVWLPRMRGIPVAINVDGIERKRAKWNMIGRLWYRLGELTSVLFASEVIADADVIAEYYANHYRCRSTVIRYGYRKEREGDVLAKAGAGTAGLESAGAQCDESDRTLLTSLGLEPNRYLLYVSRLEPENNAHVAIAAYNQLPESAKKNLPLVIVGDAPYAKDYIDSLKAMAGPGVRFVGYQFGRAYTTLELFALMYIQATEVGGTHPALVESMGYANCIIANNTPEHHEVLGEAGVIYEWNSSAALSKEMARLIDNREAVVTHRRLAFERAQQLFDWERICDQYEELLIRVAEKRRAV